MKKYEHIYITESLSCSAVINTTLQFNYWCAVVWPLIVSDSFHPMNCSLPGFSVHGISQSRILEWVAISSSRWPSRPRDWTSIPCIGRQIFYRWANSTIFQLWVEWGNGLILVSQTPLQVMRAVTAKDKSWDLHGKLPFPLALKATATTCRQGSKCEYEIHH